MIDQGILAISYSDSGFSEGTQKKIYMTCSIGLFLFELRCIIVTFIYPLSVRGSQKSKLKLR